MQDIELARISQEVAERFYNLVAVGEGGRCPSRVKDGPILSQTRSRSKGPLSDQVADATKPRRQCRSWVGLTRSTHERRTAGFGAWRPLARVSDEGPLSEPTAVP